MTSQFKFTMTNRAPKANTNRPSKIEPYIVNSTEHNSVQAKIKPLNHNVDQLIKNRHTTEINIHSNEIELIEDERHAYEARKNRLLKSEKKQASQGRHSTRFLQKNVRVIVTKKSMLGFKKKHQNTLIDCSISGAALLTNRIYKTGTVVNITMDFAENSQYFECSAKVVYSENNVPNNNTSNNQMYTVGLKFLDTTNEYKDYILKASLLQKLAKN
ncbi:MAG: hypothetical protein COB26_04140 [Piscirickettsiaceae bacterium]|nr:MAG: hypothetical protein COB26_04140 [Piscirickettsiaceae bacterium]